MNRREVIAGAAALAACSPEARSQAAPAPAFPMRRGVNLGNALEAPNEGEWGYRIDGAHLRAIAEAGFDGVRLPVRWDNHLDGAGRIDPVFLYRVQEVASWAIDLDLHVQLNVHHYERFIAEPARERERFLALWRQIGEAFSSAPPNLLFELLNEPNGPQLTGARLSEVQNAAIEVVRESNAQRLIVLGPGNWQNVDALRDWRPPAGENIAVSVHYYEPHAFTHQGAEWLGADAPVFGRDWGDDSDRSVVRQHIRQAADWARQNGYAVQLGEFGVNRTVPLPQRAAWTSAVRDACVAYDIGWCVWDFAGAFPIWDRERGAFIPQLREALFAREARIVDN